MAIKATLQIGDPRLKAPNSAVKNFNSPKLKKLVRDLVGTMCHNGLVGMAAPQIGENYQVFVTEPRQTQFRPADQADELRVYINPKIIHYSRDQAILYEGCGSVAQADLFGPVRRPKEVIIEAINLKKQKFRLECDGLLARVIQHEYDHLSGIEFTEKITDYRKLLNGEFYLKKVRNSPRQIHTSLITKKKYEAL